MNFREEVHPTCLYFVLIHKWFKGRVSKTGCGLNVELGKRAKVYS